MKTPTLILSFILACAVPAAAHEWDYPHHDEYLSFDEARGLGFEIRIDEIQWHDRRTGSTVNAVGIQVDYPITITGEQIVAADYFSGCDPLHSDTLEELDDDDAPTRTIRYWTDHVFPKACVDDSVFWAIYGAPAATTFYWVGFDAASD